MKKKKVLIVGLILVMLVIIAVSLSFVNNIASNQREQVVETPDNSSLYMPEGNEVAIVLGEEILVNGNVEDVDDGKITISREGTYRITGQWNGGQIYIDAGKEDDVVLILDNMEIFQETEPAIYIENADHTIIEMEDGTVNRVQSGSEIDLEEVRSENVQSDYGWFQDSNSENTEQEDDVKGAAIYSRDDLQITGEGSLNVYGYLNNGIASTNDLIIENGTIEVTAVKHGIKGKDSLSLAGGNCKIQSVMDGLHSNGEIDISGGTYNIVTGDDGIHSDTELSITGGEIDIASSYEGIEANQIVLTDGTIAIVSSDDGINAYGGQSRWGGNQNADAPEESPNLYIQGGTLYVNAQGDGIDSNGSIFVEGGSVIVDGPTGDWNGAIDSGSENGGECIADGGTILAIGSSGMAETFHEDSNQYSFRHNFDTSFSAESEIIIMNEEGDQLISHRAGKNFNSVVFSSPELQDGQVYILKVGAEEVEIKINSKATISGRQSRWSW